MPNYFEHFSKSPTWETVEMPPTPPQLSDIVVIEHTLDDAPPELLRFAGIKPVVPGESLIDLL